jgi:outer membrane lipoprotein-sorting protein
MLTKVTVRSRRPALAVSLLAGLLVAPALAAASSNPWTALQELRTALETDSPLRARFVQTYVPAGFSSGEEEAGWFAVSLPDCLRWDYEEPYPKAFLLCGRTVYYWSPGEKTGQKYAFESEEEPGLDFFLLTIDDLRLRYNAAAEERADGALAIRLVPIRPTEQVVEAQVVLDASHHRLRTLAYRDAEGSLTRFDIQDYEPGAASELFTPTSGMTWEEP